ncbi:MAG: phosphoribosylamine--glycine ligase [Bacteroidales bacterium]|nr:phosphoribosylamine--glycine ligase [Bacteroidales bacterium]
MKKKVLVVGGGGREHAIVEALSRSMQVGQIYCAPGNAGIGELAACVPLKDTDVDGLLHFAQEHDIDLTVVGPEAALAAGIVDKFRAAGLKIFGHTQAATAIESSKDFAKRLMAGAKVPTAAYRTFTDFDEAWAYVQAGSLPTVIKYDGLAAGKGVVVATSLAEAEAALRDMLLDGRYGEGKVVIEEFLTGPEFSLMAFVSGRQVRPMVAAQDHKRAFDGDEGPNTGGMGAYTESFATGKSGLSFISDEEYNFAVSRILQPVANAMADAGTPLSGVLYGGLMKTPSGIKVIEFNARFGDPETEVVLPRLETDSYEVFEAVATGGEIPALRWRDEAVLGVVLASKGYPGSYAKDAPITVAPDFAERLCHMGTKRDADGSLLTAGGRVLMVIASAPTTPAASRLVYAAVEKIHCDNLFYRHDIAKYVIPGLTGNL